MTDTKKTPRPAAKKTSAAAKKTPTPTRAETGKVSGTGTVAPTEKAGGEEAISAAWEAGNLASKRGTPTRPPLGYSNAEVKAWYAGYKAHANPQTGTRVEDIEGAYRGSY